MHGNNFLFILLASPVTLVIGISGYAQSATSPIPDTGVATYFNNIYIISDPSAGQMFCYQDAQYRISQPS